MHQALPISRKAQEGGSRKAQEGGVAMIKVFCQGTTLDSLSFVFGD